MNAIFAALFGESVWAVLQAVLLLILAFIAAAIVRSLTVKLLTKTRLQNLLGKRDAESGRQVTEFTGKLVHLIVFLLFVPGIFERLGMTEVSSPILGILNTMWGYLPNILAAVVVLWAGVFIAKLVRELLIPVFDRLKVNRLQEKAGIAVEESGRLSSALAYIVYVLILIPVVITALRALNIRTISDPAIRMLEIIFAFIPNILAALMIIVIGCMAAKLAGNIVERLTGASGLDSKLAERMGNKDGKFILSKVAGGTVHAVLVIFFLVESFGVLHLEVLTNIGNAVIAYLPYVLAAVLILLACYIGSSLAEKALSEAKHPGLAQGCKAGIYSIGVFMVLSELRIAPQLVNAVFILGAAALAAAFALSFGIGGREFAGHMLKKLEAHTAQKREQDAP